ncbi:MAG: TROVE domain-containing protein [Bacillota bacterium]|nr:MAG: TROVE domain-containing protein [Bacillota bacterium]
MNRVRRVFGNRIQVPASTTVNREGYPAYERPIEEQYVQTLLTNTLGNTFYAMGEELLKEAAALHDRMVAEDPEFVARALPYARQKGYMRTQPIFGLAKLAQHPLFEEVFGRVILTPKDLSDFAVIVKALRGGEGGRRIKRVAGRWLASNLNEYWAIKYGGKAAGYTLRDLFRVYHPVYSEPRSNGNGVFRGVRSPLVDYVLGRDADLSALPQVAAFERLKRAETDQEKVAAITEGRLPHEVASAFAGKSPAVWSAIVPQMPILALVRHLATIERLGIADQHREYIEGKLTNPEAVQNSKILPFTFAKAFQRVSTPWIQDALRAAVDLSFTNLPELPGRVAVLVDRSGSMEGNPVQVAALFGVALMRKANLNGRLLLFDHEVQEFHVSGRDSILSQAERITARGGTDLEKPVRVLLEDRDRVDTIIVITDEQQNAGSPFLRRLLEYRQKVNPAVKTFVVNVAPYLRASVAPPEVDGVYYIYGWSERVLDIIALVSRGFGSMVEALRRGAA